MKKGLGVGIAVLGWLGASALGAGFQLYTEGSAEALGQAAAIGGRDDLVSLAWYNPSALAGTDRSAAMAGIAIVQIQTDFHSSSNASLNASMDDDWRTIPHFYFVQPIATNLTALLSVNAPYGLITEWPRDWAGNLAAIYSEFSTIYTTPSLAWRINERASVSLGFNVVYADAELSAGRGALGVRTVKGDDIGYGYTASAHGALGNGWSIGARYQSRVKVKLDGRVDFEAYPASSGSARVDLPASVNVGLVNRPVDKLQLGFDVIWTEWSAYDELAYSFGAGYPLANPEVNAKHWKDVWSIRMGGEYEVAEAWVVRAGYVWDQSPVNDATRSPELPGSDRQMLTAGVGWLGGRLGVDLGYSYLWARDSRTGSEVAAKVPALAGSYYTVTHIVGLSARYEF